MYQKISYKYYVLDPWKKGGVIGEPGFPILVQYKYLQTFLSRKIT